ncbi:MAG TPA: amidohydrolase family protein [Stellaceae bacterium]|nr:amidohydrolase family protein [Stellaceae bacterium]
MPASKQTTIVDTHHHMCSAAYVDYIKAKTGMVPYVERILRNGSAEKSLEDMDKGGVARSIISLTTPGVWFGDVAEGRRLARECNEHFAKTVADHPARYGMFAVLPLPDTEGSLREIAYAFDTLKADGVCLFTSYQDRYLGDEAFAPVFEELNRRKAVVYTHPRRPDCCVNLLPEISEAVIEYGTDTTRTIASLVFSGRAARCPDIKFLFSHAGGTMPFLIGRFTGLAQSPQYAQALPHGVLHELQRFHYDLAQASNPGATASLMKLVKISQVLFGTDFPYNTAAAHLEGLKACGFTPAELQAIYYDNAARLMPRARVA